MHNPKKIPNVENAAPKNINRLQRAVALSKGMLEKNSINIYFPTQLLQRLDCYYLRC